MITGKPLELITYLYNQDKEKEFELKEYKKKRSINANNYAWLLMEELAKALNISKDEVYEDMLSSYGTLLRDSNGDLIIIPRKEELKSTATLHIKNMGRRMINNNLSNMYAVIKGSSEYNSKEMSIFINGIKSECELQGIQTMTDEEIKSLIKEYENEKI